MCLWPLSKSLELPVSLSLDLLLDAFKADELRGDHEGGTLCYLDS